MRRFSGLLSAAAMLFALFTAPYFHLHDHNDDGSPASLVHAHPWEPHRSDAHSDTEIEAPHSNDQARAVDFFTVSAPSAGFELAVVFSQAWSLPPLEEREQITLSTVPRAHGPPDTPRFAPRSPPAV